MPEGLGTRLVASALTVIAFGGAAAGQPLPPPGAASCSGCHGAELTLEAFDAEEIADALDAFRDGSRESTVMNRIARGFTEAESAAIAAWITGK